MPRARYKEIADALSQRIASGELRPGSRLPTVRGLMAAHKVALATAVKAYRELEKAGLVVGETGRGTFVRDTTLPRAPFLEQAAARLGALDLTFSYPTLPGQDALLRQGLRELAAAGDLDALLHMAPQGGRPHEREVFARHLRNRGLRAGADQVLLVNGAQQGLAAAVMATLSPGDVLALDALTYPGMKALAELHRLDLAVLPMAGGCTDLDALAALARRRRIKAVYAMPTLHNPLGTVMPPAARRRLAALAEAHDFLLIEDGAYAFLAEPAPAPLFMLAPHRTLYVSSLSKSVAGSLRAGFIAAPPALVPALQAAIRVTSWGTSAIATALAARWILAGEVDRLEAAKRRDAAARQRLARRVLGGAGIDAHPNSYFLWIRLPPGARSGTVAAALAKDGILLSTAEPFALTPHVPQALRVAIGSVPLPALEAALARVRRAVDDAPAA